MSHEATAVEDVTPAQLVERFCSPDLVGGLVAQAGTVEENGLTISRGHCGYMGGRGDSLITGFDDGYAFMGYLGEHGWNVAADKGDWPYVVYMTYAKREPYAIAEYCEGDITIWTFTAGQQAQAFYKTLKDCP